MDWEPWVHFAHVLASIVWVGGGLTLSVVGWRAHRSADLAVMRALAGMLFFLGIVIFAPAMVVVLLSGVWLVLDAAGDFTELWIVLALTAFALAFLLGAVYLSRTVLRLKRLAESGDLAGTRAALGSWLTGYAVVVAILVFALWDMVFKPSAGG